jgi:hypothetical protein
MNEILSKILFIDIETVTQFESYKDLSPEWKVLWSKQVKQSYRDHFIIKENSFEENEKQLNKSYFEKGSLHAEFAKVICLCIGAFIFDTKESDSPILRVKSIIGTEEKIINTFNNVVGQKFDRLCAHNGKKFDFPFLARRSIINDINIHPILDIRGAKPWEVLNIDTQDLWRFGDTVYPSLSLLCETLGIEGKDGLDGSSVHDAFYKDKDIPKIAKYCSGDIVSLAKLFLRLQFPKIKIKSVSID